jgi:carbonic anhydrase
LARESVDRARSLSPHAQGHALLELVVEQNVLVQIEHLQTYPAVRDAVREGRLRLHGWRYEFDSGQVNAFDAASGAFVPLPASSQKLLVPAIDGSLLPGSSAAWEI